MNDVGYQRRDLSSCIVLEGTALSRGLMRSMVWLSDVGLVVGKYEQCVPC